MNKAIVSIKGHQYFVTPGDKITVDGVIGKKDTQITLDTVLLTLGDTVEVGTPNLKVGVVATVCEVTKSPKIKIATFKAKSRYRKVRGHRQAQTVLEVKSIGPLPAQTKSVKKA